MSILKATQMLVTSPLGTVGFCTENEYGGKEFTGSGTLVAPDNEKGEKSSDDSPTYRCQSHLPLFAHVSKRNALVGNLLMIGHSVYPSRVM